MTWRLRRNLRSNFQWETFQWLILSWDIPLSEHVVPKISMLQPWEETPDCKSVSVSSCYGLDIVCQAPSNKCVSSAHVAVFWQVSHSPPGESRGISLKNGKLCFCQKRWGQELLRRESASLWRVTHYHCGYITLQCIFLKSSKKIHFVYCLSFSCSQTLPLTVNHKTKYVPSVFCMS